MKAFWIAACLAVSALACGSDDDGDGGGDEQQQSGGECDDVPSFDEVTAFSAVCTNCHDSSLSGADRNGAPRGYDFDLYESAADEAEEIAEEVEEGAMPPPGSGFTLTAAQERQLILWAECGAPE